MHTEHSAHDSAAERKVGSDRVVAEADGLVIRSRADMLDWPTREFHRPRVHVDGKEYAIVDRTREESPDRRVFRYRLSPWRDPREEPSAEIYYDEEYVHERDRERALDVTMTYLRPLVPVAMALIGLWPSSWKSWLEERTGCDARAATLYSVWLEGMVAFLLMVTLCITLFVTALSRMMILQPWPLGFIVAVLVVDTIMRLDSVMRDDRVPSGVLEWIFRRRARRDGRKDSV